MNETERGYIDIGGFVCRKIRFTYIIIISFFGKVHFTVNCIKNLLLIKMVFLKKVYQATVHKAVEVTLLISYNGGDLDKKCLNLNLLCVTLSVLPNTAKYG